MDVICYEVAPINSKCDVYTLFCGGYIQVIGHFKTQRENKIMIELNILFWNTYKKALTDEVIELVIAHDINFIVLLENTADNTFLVNKLKNIAPAFKQFNTILFNRPKIFSSLPLESVKEIIGHGRYGIFEINTKDYEKALLTITHFPSKMNWGNPNDHFGLCVELRTDIDKAEITANTRNTIILGDFNMNPFEEGLINSSGLHNTNNKEIALTGQRNFQGRSYEYFYNPMWSFLGDSSKGTVQGTHFFNTYKPLNHFWNMYDQVMIRPELIPFFDETKLDIISSINSRSLLKTISGYTRIDKDISDHLPIKFQIKLNKTEKYEELVVN